MRVLIATDAWPPQVNGVVRTLLSLQRAARALGVDIEFLSPDGFRTVPVPIYPGLRLAIPSRRRIAERIETVRPDAGNFDVARNLILRKRGGAEHSDTRASAVCCPHIRRRYICSEKTARH
jgi:hypothetical protein